MHIRSVTLALFLFLFVLSLNWSVAKSICMNNLPITHKYSIVIDKSSVPQGLSISQFKDMPTLINETHLPLIVENNGVFLKQVKDKQYYKSKSKDSEIWLPNNINGEPISYIEINKLITAPLNNYVALNGRGIIDVPSQPISFSIQYNGERQTISGHITYKRVNGFDYDTYQNQKNQYKYSCQPIEVIEK